MGSMDAATKNVQETVTDRATAEYVESLGVSIADIKLRTEMVDASQQRSALQIMELRKKSLRLLCSLSQLEVRIGKLPAKVRV